MGLTHRRAGAGSLHHAGRGVQPACDDYRALLNAHAIAVSISGKGECWDNAVAESFFATLNAEPVTDTDWQTREDARKAFRYLAMWYNPPARLFAGNQTLRRAY